MEHLSPKTFARMVPRMRKATLASILKEPLTGREVPVRAESSEDQALTWWHPAPSTLAADASPADPRPVFFELHGGGFAMGDARKGDALRAWVARRYDVHVVGINYRLAPDHAWPCALDDVRATLASYAAHAVDRSLDPQAFYLMGYSAGANLAAATCLAAQPDDAFRVAGCVLHYPFLDAARNPEEIAGESDELPTDMMEAFNAWYTAGADPRNPLISPYHASEAQLARLPRMLLYAVENDVLFESAVQFSEKLQRAGTPCSLHTVPGVYHGYLEDAANLRVFAETSMPQTIASRPAGFAGAAARVFAASLDELLGAPADPIPFVPETRYLSLEGTSEL